MDKELRDQLFSARWAVANDKKEYAYEKITEALLRIGALNQMVDEFEELPEEIPPEAVEIEEPEFVEVSGVKFKDRGAYRTPSGKFKGLVVHYTVSNRTAKSAVAVLRYLANHKYRMGCMVMDEDGKIYIPKGWDPLTEWGGHAGKSSWKGDSGLSDEYAGMEICCWGKGSKVGPFRSNEGEENIIKGKYQQFTDKQEKALTNFILWARQVNNEFQLDLVVGHDEARADIGLKGDKSDPGASLSLTMPKYRQFLVQKEKALK